jgi:Animal haem peroxidase
MKKYDTPRKPSGHGSKGYWVVGEGYYKQDRPEPVPEPDEPGQPMVMRFCRMFPDLKQSPGEKPEREALEALGETMSDPDDDPSSDANIPAGMTYLGQFIDHDISRTPGDGTDLATVDDLDRTTLPNERTPALDLDSVYGAGPGNADFFDDDGMHLKIGQTVPVQSDGAPQLPNDLPRRPESDPGKTARKAAIADHRNDENLAMAQTHLAFLKFHNKVVDNEAPANFEAARRIVRQHYQSVVWHDFVPRLVDPAVYQDVHDNGRQWFMPGKAAARSDLCMPVEFSVAAYRLGHSMVRNTYEWNRVFSTSGPRGIATLKQLFDFSELSGDFGGFGAPTLPANWIVDWTRLHDFSDVAGVNNHPSSNKTRLIDTRLALLLEDLPEFQNVADAALRMLSVRNLLRGAQLSLPTGQAVAEHIGVSALTPDQVKSGPHEAVITQHGFHVATPLWYYILKEAEVQQGGQRLGEVGSRIVVETFHGLVEGSQDSIFVETNWQPSLTSTSPDRFTMADLLAYTDDLNPLGDASA